MRTLRADEIEVKVKQLKGASLMLLLYKTARTDMDILDETFGPKNWMRTHELRGNSLYCAISIWDEDKKSWVVKEDVGSESDTEAEKGQASDSFKRAGTNWGIGRELYTSPPIWVKANLCNIKTNRQGEAACYDDFEVTKIEYNDGSICALEIYNKSTDKIVYTYNKTTSTKRISHEQQPIQTQEPATCDTCGKTITPVQIKSGDTWSAADIITYAKKRYGRCICTDCMKVLNASPKEREGNINGQP